MNSPNKKPPGTRAIPQPLNRPAVHAMPFKPVVAQLKTSVSAQSAKRPVAPPVYRPQAVPKVLQLKTSKGIANSKLPVAPPVYRPSPRPVEFRRTVGGSRAVQLAEKHPMAPPPSRPSSSSSSSSSEDKEKKIRRPPVRERSQSPALRRAASEASDDRSRSRSRSRRSNSFSGEDEAPRPPGELGKGRRERQPSAKLRESEEGGIRRERRRSVSENAEARKARKNEFDSPAEQKLERSRGPKATAPGGVFLPFGQRGDVNWAVTSATNGMKGDEYIYYLARSGVRVNKDSSKLPDYKDENGKDEYRCAKCDKYFDRGRITVDHVPPMSRRLNAGTCLAYFCDGRNVWEGQHKQRCIESYNDPTRLQMMCDSCNSSKGGLSGYIKAIPEIVGTCEQFCEDSHSDVREVGRTE